MAPYFVTTDAIAIQSVSEAFQSTCDLAVTEPIQPAHYSGPTGTCKLCSACFQVSPLSSAGQDLSVLPGLAAFRKIASSTGGSGSPCSMQDSVMPDQAQSSSQHFLKAVSFRNQSRDVGARCDIATFIQLLCLDPEIDRAHLDFYSTRQRKHGGSVGEGCGPALQQQPRSKVAAVGRDGVTGQGWTGP